MLCGRLPLHWVHRPFELNWTNPALREQLLESRRNTCKLHEQIGFDEMLNHEWLPPDRAVQKATFSSGTMVVFKVGDKPYDLRHEGTTYRLSPLGFFAKGAKIPQYRIRQDSRDVTDGRMSYVIYRGQKDGRFGQIDHARLTHPPRARIVP